MGSNPAQGNYSFPQKLSSVEFPVTFSQFLLNLDCESICDPPGGDTLLAQGIYLTVSLSIYIYITSMAEEARTGETYNKGTFNYTRKVRPIFLSCKLQFFKRRRCLSEL